MRVFERASPGPGTERARQSREPLKPAPKRELARVTLVRPVHAEDGVVPAGSTGTVLHVYRDGSAYEVEFTGPLHAVVTVEADALAG